MSALNSRPASEEESFSGPVRLVFVVIRQTLGGTVSSRLGANHPGEMVLTCADICANSGPSSDGNVTLRPNGACVCAIPACPWWCRRFPINRDAVPSRKVVVLRSLGNFENRASWGCRTVSDLRLWINTWRRARRLRSRLSRVWMLPDRGFPTGVFRSLALGAMVDSPVAPRDVIFLEEHLAGKLLFAMCMTAAIVARQFYGC